MLNTTNIASAMISKKPLLLGLFFGAIIALTIFKSSTKSNDFDWLHNEGVTKYYNSGSASDNTNSDSIDNLINQVSYNTEFFHDKQTDYSKYVFTNLKTVEKSEKGESAIVLSTISNKEAYGGDRSFGDLFKTIMSLNFSMNELSMGFLVGDAVEFQNVHDYLVEYFDKLKEYNPQLSDHRHLLKMFLRKVTIIHAPFIEKDFHIDRQDRHKDTAQRLRRRSIARARNFLLYQALNDERYTLFIDSDIIKIKQTDMLQTFIDTGKDIIVPRVEKGGDEDYDRNSWKGERTKPTAEQLAIMDSNDWEKFDYVPKDVADNLKHIYHFYKEGKETKKPEDNLDMIVELDSVGGAVLFVKSCIFQQGISFPPVYVVGTTWDRLEGYDGIETEGLCYLAKPLGYKCWGMPNQVAQHSVHQS